MEDLLHPERAPDFVENLLCRSFPIIMFQPATAQFLTKRLYLFFVADHPGQEAIDQLAQVYHSLCSAAPTFSMAAGWVAHWYHDPGGRVSR